MHRRAPPLLHKAPEGLHVVMMHAAPANPQPLAFSRLHQLQRHMRVLELLPGAGGFQIRAAKDEPICAQRIGQRFTGHRPSLHLAVPCDQLRIHAHNPRHRIADVQERSDVGAEGAHLRRGQIIALHSERLRVRGEAAHGEFDIVGMRDLIVGIDEDDVFAGGVLEGEPLGLLHVASVIIDHHRAMLRRDGARRVLRHRIGEDDFVAVARIGLPGDGRQAVFQQGRRIQRRHDETDLGQGFGHRVEICERRGRAARKSLPTARAGPQPRRASRTAAKTSST